MMNKSKPKQIEVYAHWQGLMQPILMGNLYASLARGKEIFSFAYDATWLKQGERLFLDPNLQLFPGLHYPPMQQDNFGIFLDSSPDRWGRLLMRRREAQQARDEARAERMLLESDYLLGVYDEHRIGALRFRLNSQGPFLDQQKKFASPPWTSLHELEHASLAIEKENAESDPAYRQWLNMLIAPGGSLGGARPKASVVDEQQQLWIAKFPSANDEYDIGAWEMVAYQLAKKAGITTADAQLCQFNSKHHTFLSKRFDRTQQNDRLHFGSAMTLLQHHDGDDAASGASYLELAEFIIKHGMRPTVDLEQLWRRIVFSICISNVDDHLRNHGFLLNQPGWLLAPAFDINPVATGNGLKLNISESDNAQDLHLTIQVANYFDLTLAKAEQIISEITTAVKTWRQIATQQGISPKEQEKMANAFRIADNF